MPRLILAAAALATLTACEMETPTMPPAPMPAEDACGASALQDLVGQPETVLATMRFASPTRIVAHGMAVTMDYSPNRLNIWIGEDKRINRVTCG